MNKQKFKVGDRVRIVKACVDTSSVGVIGEIDTIDPTGCNLPYLAEIECEGYRPKIWCYEVEHVKTKLPVIVITSDGKTTTATLREGKKVIKTASAKCSDKDTFDFAEGARIAFEWLQGRDPFPKEKKPERPGKLVCVKEGCGGFFEAGKVYGIKWETGRDVFDFGVGAFGLAGWYHDGRYIAPSNFGDAEFIPFVED